MLSGARASRPGTPGRLAAVVLAAALAAAGCSSTPLPGDSSHVGVLSQTFGKPDAVAVAQMQPVAGSRVDGRVTFAQFGAVVVVRARFFGLEPNSEHGLHVRERGDCRGTDGAAAGGHFDPGGAVHGRPGRGAHHAGDLPNVNARGEGEVFYVYETAALTVDPGAASVVGRSVILTRDRDDYRTQPDGASGPPLACGIVRRE
jgi:Cu-Zn family superoxide dismutase